MENTLSRKDLKQSKKAERVYTAVSEISESNLRNSSGQAGKMAFSSTVIRDPPTYSKPKPIVKQIEWKAKLPSMVKITKDKNDNLDFTPQKSENPQNQRINDLLAQKL